MRTKNKTISLICAAILLLSQQVTAQKATPRTTQINTQVESTIKPQLIEIAYNKTTNLIFPYAIKSVDRGSREVLVKKVEGVDNILMVKAGIENFEPTNLSVVTGEGTLYSFTLHYHSNPSKLNFKITSVYDRNKPTAMFSNAGDWESRVQSDAQRVFTKKKTLKGIHDRRNQVSLELNGLYLADKCFYLQFGIENNTQIPYDVGQFRLYIRDKRKAKRTASQEIEIRPLFTYGNAQFVNAQSEQVIVLVVDKFTIPDKKELIVQLLEKNGGRNLQLKINNKQISKIKAIQ